MKKTVSPYKNKKLIEHFMKDAGITGKHTRYVILMENYQVLTSRDLYNVKFRDESEREAIAATWPSACPILVHRNKLFQYMGLERSKQFWDGGLSRL